MNKYKAAKILENTLTEYSDSFTEEGKEAIEEGILALYNQHAHLTSDYSIQALRCVKCHKPIFLQGTREYDAVYGITNYTAECPYCGKKYEWNNCYWR